MVKILQFPTKPADGNDSYGQNAERSDGDRSRQNIAIIIELRQFQIDLTGAVDSVRHTRDACDSMTSLAQPSRKTRVVTNLILNK